MMFILVAGAMSLPIEDDPILGVLGSERRHTTVAYIQTATGGSCDLDSEDLSGEKASSGLADSVMSYQKECGGWYKSEDYGTSGCKSSSDKSKAGTIDNGATTSEIQYMAKAGKELGESDYTKSAKRGIQFLLDAQYPEKLDGKTLKGAGGWPQYYGGDDLCKGDCYPDQSGSTSYYRDVTFNDNAHITVMKVLEKVYKEDSPFDKSDYDDLRKDCKSAWEKGVEVLLNAQIVANGVKTGWCAQHDRETLWPTSARSYELASISGAEGSEILKYLGEIEDPSDDVRKAVCSARDFYKTMQIKGIELKKDKKPNYFVENSDNTMYARFMPLQALPNKGIIFAGYGTCSRSDSKFNTNDVKYICTSGDFETSKLSYWMDGDGLSALNAAFKKIGDDRNDGSYDWITGGAKFDNRLDNLKDYKCPSSYGTRGVDIGSTPGTVPRGDFPVSPPGGETGKSCARSDDAERKEKKQKNSGEECTAHCKDKGYPYAVLEEDDDCGCYKEYPCKSNSGSDMLYMIGGGTSCTRGGAERKEKKSKNSGDECIAHCKDKGYPYAVFESDRDCGCYKEYPCKSTEGSDTLYQLSGATAKTPTEDSRRRRRSDRRRRR